MRSALLLISLCTLGVVLSGCPQPSGGGNQNVNAAANENESGGAATLTAAQQAAITDAVQAVAGLGQVFMTLGSFADEGLVLDNLGSMGTFGDCPAISFLRGLNSDNILITFDFGDGCSTLKTGNLVVSGVVSAKISRSTHQGTIEFLNLVVDGRAITGQMAVTVQDTPTGANLTGSMTNVQIAGLGQFSGSFTVSLARSGQITITTATFSVLQGGNSQQITLAGVVFDPVATLNLVPLQGTASFEVPASSGAGTVPALVTFMTETPQNGTVQVRINGGATIEFQVPGLV